MFLLIALFLVPVVAEGEFGQCLYNLTFSEGVHVLCSPPNTLPQICSLTCGAGYFPGGNSGPQEFTCMNSICTNRCQATQKTCVGAVPVQRDTYTEYVREERPCCELTKVEAPWCDLGSCTGSCTDPGVYTFEALACPDICVPYRDVEQPDRVCVPCELPPLPSPAVYLTVEGSPPAAATYGCPAGMWGIQAIKHCSPLTGDWTPHIPVTCEACEPHTYALEELPDDVFEVTEEPGRVEVRCREDQGFEAREWIYMCDRRTGRWSPQEDMVCVEPSVSPTPTSSATPSPLGPSPTPSKTPRPPKVKGSRAPTAPPKIRGSRAPSNRVTA